MHGAYLGEGGHPHGPEGARGGPATGATGEPPPPAGRKNATFPVEIDPEKWHTFTLETVDDSMRATIDGKPVAFLKSPGIAHATKSKVEFGCMGKDGFFDDVKIWNAEPVK